MRARNISEAGQHIPALSQSSLLCSYFLMSPESHVFLMRARNISEAGQYIPALSHHIFSRYVVIFYVRKIPLNLHVEHSYTCNHVELSEAYSDYRHIYVTSIR